MADEPRPSRASLEREMLDAIGEAVIATDLAGQVTFWNAAAERLYGWSAAEAVGRNIVDLTPTSASRQDAEEIMGLLAQGRTWHGTFEVQRRGGEVFPALVTDAPLLDDQGELIGIIGVSVDITGRLEEQEAARRGRAQAAVAALARAGLECPDVDEMFSRAVAVVAAELEVPVVIVGEQVASSDGLVVRASHGWTPDADAATVPAVAMRLDRELGCRSFEDLRRLPVGERPPAFLVDRGVRSGVTTVIGGARGGFGALAVYDTEPRRFSDDEVAFLDAIGGVLAGVVARIAVEDRLRGMVDQLRTSEEIRLAFLRATSHELRTPLAAILGFAETLRVRDGVLREEERSSFVRILGANAARLDRLIADLLDVDRLTSGLVMASRHPCQLDEVVLGILEDIDHPRHRVDVDVVPVRIAVDVPKLERVVHHLVVNGLRHTPEGGTVTVRLRAVGPGALLIVEDEGSGIDEAYLDRIFEPFVQGPDQALSASPGTGLGLAMVRELVALHGGDVRATNRDEGGARFEVSLPGSDLSLLDAEELSARST